MNAETRTHANTAPTTAATPVRSGLTIQRKCSCGGSAGLTGKCDECEKKKLAAGGLQKKLTVNEPGDAYEQEADRVAEQVMRMPAPVSAVSRNTAPAISRAATGGGGGAEAPGIVHDVLRSSGQPLDAGTRAFMEPRFGHDFSGVRVHTDARAAESARAVNALAYTVGRDVVFGEGQYAPGSGSGQRLLAHELTHVVQQGGAMPPVTGSAGHAESMGVRRGQKAVGRTVEADVVRAPITPASYPVLSRAATPQVPGMTRLQIPKGADPIGHVAFEVDEAFPLPPEKGPVQEIWNQIAVGGGLKASLDLRGAPIVDVKQGRHDLRPAWLAKVKWSKSQADARWSDLEASVLKKKPKKGKALIDEFPRIDDIACHMDHVVELQVFGGNEKENIQVLDPTPNVTSGGAIRTYLLECGNRIKAALGSAAPPAVVLVWRSVKQDSAICGPCCEMEKAAVATAGSIVPDSAEGQVSSEGIAAKRKKVTHLGKESEILIPTDAKSTTKSTGVVLRESTIVENRAVSRLVPGISLVEYFEKQSKISAEFDPDGVRLPLELKKKAGKSSEIAVVVDAVGELVVKAGTTKVPIHYSKLSDGSITHVEQKDGTLAGSGTITPSIPLLKGAELAFEFADNYMAVTKDVPKDKLTSLPGMRVTKAGLKFQLAPEFKPSGTIEFEVGSKEHPLATGSIIVSADAEGFVANGHLIANIPGMDKAEGDVTYRSKQGWSGKIELKTSKAFVKSVSAVIGFDDKGISVTGGAVINLPGGKTADLTVARDEKIKKWVFSGRATIDVPGGRVKPVEIAFHYDGEKVNGKGHTTFTLGSHGGDITIEYNDGKISGEGSIAVKTSRVSGKIHVKLSQAQKFSGEGELTVQIAKNLIGTIGVAIDENGKTKAKGGFEFTEPYVLFKRFGGDYQIFKTGVSIPIPGLSIGPLGVKVAINGALSAGYHIGPGELRGIKAMGTADDLTSDNVALDLMLEGQLYIGGGAHITGSIEGAIMLDVGLASASGGLRISASAVLEGSMLSGVKVHYTKGRFEVDADFNLLLALALKLGLGAFVQAQAGIGPFKVETRKDWTLASYTFDTGLKLGVRTKKPVHYASDKPFAPPGLDQIEVTKPNIDVQNMLSKIFAGSSSKEIKT